MILLLTDRFEVNDGKRHDRKKENPSMESRCREPCETVLTANIFYANEKKYIANEHTEVAAAAGWRQQMCERKGSIVVSPARHDRGAAIYYHIEYSTKQKLHVK